MTIDKASGFPVSDGSIVEMMEWYCKKIEETIKKSIPQGNSIFDQVIRAMEYSLQAGGKRIRPMLTLEFARITGGSIEQALPVACAIEFIHTFSLIHDDLPCMDNDDIRRGKPSCHKAFGETIALLAGDGLSLYATEYIAKCSETTGLNPAKAIKLIEIISRYSGVKGMIGGQEIDILSKNFTETTILEMYKLKTSCLLMASCQMGCVIGNADEKKINSALDFAENLGLAFQIVDDILDVEGDEAVLGKPVGSDVDSHKITYVTLLGVEKAKNKAKELSEKAIRSLDCFENSQFLRELCQKLLYRIN